MTFRLAGRQVAIPPEIRTRRLHLRRWRPEDLEPFAALNADPRVMEHFPGVLGRVESDALARRIDTHFDRYGFGLWAVEIPGAATFAGFVGLSVPGFEDHFTPCVEIGWRLAAGHWNQGYATEGALAVLRLAAEAGIGPIVSFTVPANVASRRVMEKIGLVRDPEGDFDHPGLPAGHRLRRHVLYRATGQERVGETNAEGRPGFPGAPRALGGVGARAEGRPGFPGAPRALGGVGGHFVAPHLQKSSKPGTSRSSIC